MAAGNKLRRWREKHHLMQAELADHLDVHFAALSNIEGGRKKPGRALAVRIQKFTKGSVKVADWDSEEK